MTNRTRRNHHRTNRRLQRHSMGVESLEDRLALATLTVNSLLDGPIDLSDSTVTLRDAIHAANQDVPARPGGPSGNGDDVIQFQFGLGGTVTLNQGQLPIRSDLTMIGPVTTVVTIYGNNASRVFDITDFGPTALNVTIRDLIVTGGNAPSYSGGGILNRENLTIENCTISGNSSGVDGGGVANRPLPNQNIPNLTVVNSTISQNNATNNGGGIVNYGHLNVQNSMFQFNRVGRDGGAIWNGVFAEVQGSYFANNVAATLFAYASGGGFYNGDNATATITGSTFTHNAASFGGAVRGGGTLAVNSSVLTANDAVVSGAAIVATHGNTTLNNVTMTNNTANIEGGGLFRIAANVNVADSLISGNLAGDGGGISSSYNVGTLTVTRSTITGNRAVGNGGGMFNFRAATVTQSTISGNEAGSAGGGLFNDGPATIDRTLIAGNTAGYGAGIWSDTFRGEFTIITNSTISGNVASRGGGGVENNYGLTLISHSTITDNMAPSGSGSGVESFGDIATTTRVHSSIIAGNVNTDIDYVLSIVNSFQSDQFNVIGTGNAVGNFNLTGDQTLVLDPLLGLLADNGGPTRTHALLSGSPAINAGDPAFLSPPEFDQRGAPFVRVADARIDIGAFELQDTLACDFNANGVCNGLDLDALVDVIAAATHLPPFDLTGDGLVNLADRDAWLAQAGALNLPPGNSYRLGDANLDGVVDGSDFGTWNANKFTSVAAWTRGDFNADGFVDGSDFGIWNANKFTSSGDRQTSALTFQSIPEGAQKIGWHAGDREDRRDRIRVRAGMFGAKR